MFGKSCWILPLVLVLTSVQLGCAVLTDRMPCRARTYSQEELREELGDFASYFHVALGAAADAIAEGASDRRVRKRALTWKVNAIPLVQEAALDPNPQEAYVSLMTLMVLMRNYVDDGEGAEIFGEQQGRVLPVITALHEELLEIGAKFLSEKELEQLVSNVETFAERRPMVGRDLAMQSVGRALVDVEQTTIFNQVGLDPAIAVPCAHWRG